MQAQVLLWILTLPLAGAVAIAASSRWPNLREAISLSTATGLAFLVFAQIPLVMSGGRPEIVLLEPLPGLPVAFSLEPLGMIFACIASFLWIINTLYSIGYMRGNREKHQTRFYICFAIAIAATMGVAMADNLFTLFLFYEILTLSTYPLVAHKGDAKTIASARIYLGLLLTTSIGLLLPAIIWTYVAAGTTRFTQGGILAGQLDGPAIGLLLGLFVFGIGKAAVMPVHRWLPAAMVAPTPVSALLHAVAVVKAGVFAVTKIIIYIFGVDHLFTQPSAEWLQFAAAFTIVAASVVALYQTNLKRMLAYSTIGQLSYVILAAVVLLPLSKVGTALHIAAHAFGKITLFFAAGAIYTAAHKTELRELAGIGRRMPFTMTAFTIGALSMIGVPPTAGFVSKWFILSGAFQAENHLALATIIASTVLNAMYFLPIIYFAWLSPPATGVAMDHGEAPWPILLALGVTAALALGMFFFNQPLIDLEKQLVHGLTAEGKP